MRGLLAFILMALFLGSCGDLPNWKSFPAHGLPQKDEGYNDLLFVDSLTGYLGGDRMISLGEGNTQFTIRTVLYTTKDQGHSWLQIPLDFKGSVNRILVLKDTLILLIQDVTSDSAFIIKSWNNGQNWDKLFATTSNVYIREMQFTHTDNALIVIDDRSNSFLLKLENNKWDTLLKIPYDHYHSIIQNKLFSIIPERTTANSIGLLITNIETGKTKELLFDKPYFIASVTSKEKYLYLAASYKEAGKILQISDDEIKVNDLGRYSEYQPDQVFFHDNSVMAIAHRQKDVAFLGVIHKLLISKDNGRTWSLEEIPHSMYLKPATLYKDKFFMTYCGAGYIQIRK